MGRAWVGLLGCWVWIHAPKAAAWYGRSLRVPSGWQQWQAALVLLVMTSVLSVNDLRLLGFRSLATLVALGRQGLCACSIPQRL